MDSSLRSLDEQLLAQVSTGDVEAFGRLYDVSSTLLFALAVRIVGHREEAADTLQEVYLEIWRKASRYDVSHGTPLAWLIALTRNRALERVRARTHRTGGRGSASAKPSAQVIELAPPAQETPEDAEFRRTVSLALAELPADQRQVIEWAYFDGLSYPDISARRNEAAGTTKTTIRLGMEQLRARLRASWADHPRYGT